MTCWFAGWNNFAKSAEDSADPRAAAVPFDARRSGPRIERMLAFFIEFVLEFQALIVSLDGANGFDGYHNPIVHVPLAQLFGSDGAVTRIMVRKPGVPPDAGVQVVRQ